MGIIIWKLYAKALILFSAVLRCHTVMNAGKSYE